MNHVPVLLDDVLNYLDVRPNRNYLDATVGGGGYAQAILKRNAPRGRVLGIDWDEEAVERIKRGLFGKRLILECGNFRDIGSIVRSHSFKSVAGAVFDLGLSSDLIERSGRGFSYLRDEPLIMSYRLPVPVESYKKTARDIVNSYTIDELARIFKEYGGERLARPIARAVTEARKEKRIEKTGELIGAIEQVSRSIKAKARIFQALRIETNKEVDNLKYGLDGAWGILEREGRLVVVAFHSLEDKIVKDFFRGKSAAGEGEILTKKPVGPTRDEIKENRRARSAKLRAIRKL